ncbi:hypothetical protein EON67_07565, partial [archaeon]
MCSAFASMAGAWEEVFDGAAAPVAAPAEEWNSMPCVHGWRLCAHTQPYGKHSSGCLLLLLLLLAQHVSSKHTSARKMGGGRALVRELVARINSRQEQADDAALAHAHTHTHERGTT